MHGRMTRRAGWDTGGAPRRNAIFWSASACRGLRARWALPARGNAARHGRILVRAWRLTWAVIQAAHGDDLGPALCRNQTYIPSMGSTARVAVLLTVRHGWIAATSFSGLQNVPALLARPQLNRGTYVRKSFFSSRSGELEPKAAA